MSATDRPAYEWKDLPWRAIERQVFKLQKRIYQASRRDDVRTVHRLQRLLMRSWAARCLAVRKVTQDNRGKKTAGVDGVVILTPDERSDLARTLTPRPGGHPVRRVWIPKPGKPEKRPLGIPTVHDRAAQTLARLALEPEWEARFEPNSYGFRPGRSCHDAMEAIFTTIRVRAKYVLDADIASCFDRIDHAALLRKLRTFPALRRTIHGWLEAGVLDGPEVFPTQEGTPQGGAISPLLANVALHGLETAVRAAFLKRKPGTTTRWQPSVVRYADDFVILHEDVAIIERARQVAAAWLQGMGLELKPSKTRITHTLAAHEGRVGFDFLGFTVRQFPVGKTHTGKNTYGKPLGFKTIIKPSSEAQKRHLAEIAKLVRCHRQSRQEVLIAHLNRTIGGWANYHSAQVSKRVFGRLDHLVYGKLKRWAARRHPKKSAAWVRDHYWRTVVRTTWTGHRRTNIRVFAPADGTPLALHAHTVIRRHTKVEGKRSPFDGDWVYWASRLGHHPELPNRVATLLKWQKGKCALCGLFFTVDDRLEVDHILPRSSGGKDGYINWQLVHRHCHDAKTTHDGSNDRRRSSEVPVSRAKMQRGSGQRPPLAKDCRGAG
jgi:RNA-directed DNA polymerase